VFRAAGILTRKGHAAKVADEARRKGRVPPARSAEAEILRHRRAAGNAARRKREPEGALQSCTKPRNVAGHDRSDPSG
jgi:hypothetical protein